MCAGTAQVAASFAHLDLQAVAARLRRRFRGRAFPQWAHLYWAEHVTNTLLPAGVALRFTLLHEVDFTLGRFWRYGADCVAAVEPPTAAAAPSDGGGDGASALARFANVSAFAAQLRGPGALHQS